MSWIDRLENTELEIITGDGKTFRPLWLNAQRNLNYNTEGFDFVGIDGTYVSREEQSGDQFPITLYFTGENCVEEAESFYLSSKDKRPWQVKHPFFDNILVQPLSLTFDYSDYNIVRITGTLWRTIRAKFPDDSVIAKDLVEARKADLDVDLETYAVDTILDPKISLVTPLNNSVTSINRNYQKLATTSAAVKELKDKVRAVSGAIQNVTNDLAAYTRAAIELINFPFAIASNIESSINIFLDTFDELANIFDTDNAQQQIIAEVNLTALASAMSAQFVNPGEDDYNTRSQVSEASNGLGQMSDKLRDYYDASGYAQNSDLALNLDSIINIARANLFDIAFDARQERSVFIDRDGDPVTLAHKYFGVGDEALQEFITFNKLSRNEYFEIKKGREITYFV